MKRSLAMTAVAALVTATTACSSAASATQQGGASSLMHPGSLTIGLNPPVAGFQVGTLRGNDVISPHGFEIDLGKDMAAKLGIPAGKIKWINVPFDTVFRPGPKPFDFALEEATITVARERTVDFSAPYFNANQGVLLTKGAQVPHSLADLKNMTLCAQSTTTGLAYAQHQLNAPHIQIYTATAPAFAALQAGRCKAFVMDVPIVAAQKKTNPAEYGPLAGQIETHEQYGVVLAKGSKLTAKVSAAIRALTANGTIAKLQKEWFGIDVAKLTVLK